MCMMEVCTLPSAVLLRLGSYFHVLFQALGPFQLDKDQITDSGKFRHLDELLPVMKNRVVYHCLLIVIVGILFIFEDNFV